ncbi:glycosyltransferase [Sphingosinicellaceae bacterium]|nr:glycosyltransferase [Sphingosinicellaceae bacterium]
MADGPVKDERGGPRVAVIIPHLNQPEALARCLASVMGQQLDHGWFEVVVVDNGSRTLPHEVLATYPDVRLLVEPTPRPGPARNTGVAATTAPLLAFIDADCRAEAGWLQAAVDAVEPDPEQSVVGGDVRIDFGDIRNLSPAEAYEAVFAYRQKMYIRKLRFSGTGNLAMGRSVHARVGPFGGIGIAEDRDWGQRACALGLPARYVDAMRIYHPARPDFDSLATKWRRQVAHDLAEHRGHGRPMWKWYARAGAVAASIPVSGAQLLVSERLSGLSNRFRGLGMLARTRLFRTAEMIRAVSGPSQADGWNRGA